MAKPFVIPTVFTAVDKFSSKVMAMGHALGSFTKNSPTLSLFNNIGKGADHAFEKLVNIKSALAGLAIFEAGDKIYEKIKGVAELGDKANKASKILGITAEKFQELKYAADLADIAPEQLMTGLEKLNKNVGELRTGGGSLLSTLKSISPTLQKLGMGGLVKDLQKVKNTDEAFTLVTTAIDKMPNSFKKAQLATAAFGKAGQEFLKLTAEGPEGIAKLRAEAYKYGAVISNEAAAKSEEFLDTQKRMDYAVNGLSVSLGTALMPKIQELTEKVTNWIGNNRELIKVKVAEFATKVSNALQFVADHFETIIFFTKLFIFTLLALKAISIGTAIVQYGLATSIFAYNIAIGVAGALTGVANIAIGQSAIAMGAYTATAWLATTATAAWGAALEIGLWPLTLIALAIGALIFLVYEIIKHWEDWGAAVTLFLGPLGFVISLFKSFYDNWNMIVNAFKTEGMLAGLKAIGATILDSVLKPLQQMLDIIAKVTGFQWAKDAAGGVQAFRNSMNLNMGPDADKFTPAQKPAEAFTPLLNPEQAKQEGIANKTENNTNKNVTVDFKNLPDWVKVNDDGNSVTPSLGSTMTF